MPTPSPARLSPWCASMWLAASLLLVALPAAAQPTPAETATAITTALTAMGRAPATAVQVRSIVGCYPGAGDGAPWLLCLVDMNDRNGQFGVQRVPMRRAGDQWRIHEVAGLPSIACPSKADAEPLFQKAMGTGARVTDVPDDGTLSDERGMNRGKKGPLRLMCTYEVTRSLGAVTVVAYFGYAHGKYTLDPDYEVWP